MFRVFYLWSNIVMKRSFLSIALVVAALAVRGQQNLVRFSDIKAGMNDWYIEKEAVRLANKWATDTRCPEEYTKAVIVSADWEYYYHINGELAGRKLLVQVYCERPGLQCGMADFTFRQKYLGDHEFSGKLTCKRIGDMIAVECE